MKLKVTNDIKNAMKGIFIYFVSNLVVFPVYHLIKGDFSWGDFFSIVLLNLIICLVIGAFFFVGMQVPEKKDEPRCTGIRRRLPSCRRKS